MVVRDVRSKDAHQVSLVEHDDVVQTIVSDRANEAFAIRVFPWAARRGDDFLDAHVANTLLKSVTVDSIAITNQKTWRGIIGERFDDLLGSPLSRRIGSDVEVNDVSSVVTQHDKGEKYVKRGCGDGEEVDADDVGQMVIQESPPSLRRRISMTYPILAHGCLGDRVTQQCEF